MNTSESGGRRLKYHWIKLAAAEFLVGLDAQHKGASTTSKCTGYN